MNEPDMFLFVSKDTYTVFALRPALKDAAWGDVESTGDQVLAELEKLGFPPMIVDLSELDYIGSSLVALLVRVWKKLTSQEARMVVVNRHEMVREVLELAGLANHWRIVESHEEALDEIEVSDAALVVKRESRFLFLTGPLVTIVAVVAGEIYWQQLPTLAEHLGFGVAIGVAGLACFISGISLFRERGRRRWVSGLSVLVAIGVLFAVTMIKQKRDGGFGSGFLNQQLAEPEGSDEEDSSPHDGDYGEHDGDESEPEPPSIDGTSSRERETAKEGRKESAQRQPVAETVKEQTGEPVDAPQSDERGKSQDKDESDPLNAPTIEVPDDDSPDSSPSQSEPESKQSPVSPR